MTVARELQISSTIQRHAGIQEQSHVEYLTFLCESFFATIPITQCINTEECLCPMLYMLCYAPYYGSWISTFFLLIVNLRISPIPYWLSITAFEVDPGLVYVPRFCVGRTAPAPYVDRRLIGRQLMWGYSGDGHKLSSLTVMKPVSALSHDRVRFALLRQRQTPARSA